MRELAMTKELYKEVMQEIWTFHRFGGLSPAYWDNKIRQDRCKHIKYVRPDWDMRDGMCFSIQFDGLSGTKEFHSGYGQTVPLFDQIMNWLNTPREEIAADESNHTGDVTESERDDQRQQAE